jgi:hypothetical protein
LNFVPCGGKIPEASDLGLGFPTGWRSSAGRASDL